MKKTSELGVYTRKQVKEIVGCSMATVDRLINTGELRSIRISPRRIIVPASALEEYLNGRQEG